MCSVGASPVFLGCHIFRQMRRHAVLRRRIVIDCASEGGEFPHPPPAIAASACDYRQPRRLLLTTGGARYCFTPSTAIML